jgi:enoyl-CoA hydratase/carnithine racemase
MGLKDLTLYEKRGKTAIITLNYPEKMNIYGTKGGTPTLQDVLPRALDDDEVWTIIITGAGDKAFCAG